jgi:glycosyltransferase involved in cell wall biosynthesis
MPTVVHLTASTFFGGPERQLCGLARSLPGGYQSVFLSFAEGGRCRAFLGEVRRLRFKAVALTHDTPWLRKAIREVEAELRRVAADVLCCHGYKANLLGRLAARRCAIPAVAVSRGWTGASLKVRLYEMLDRLCLRRMDRVVCVSEGQAAKVRRVGVPAANVTVIRNAVSEERFANPDPTYRLRLAALFPRPKTRIVGAAGRLSPEKGFDVLVAAARPLVREDPSLGFVLFGDGPLWDRLARQIDDAGLTHHFVLTGFRDDLDRYLPFLDLLVLSSHTEGLPNVVLEAFAAAVPVVATAVGGTPEVVEDGKSGYLVAPGDAHGLAGRIRDALTSEPRRKAMGLWGRRRVQEAFSFAAQSRQYQRLFEDLLGVPAPRPALHSVHDLLQRVG